MGIVNIYLKLCEESKFKQQFQLECNFQCIIILKFGEYESVLWNSIFSTNPICVFKPAQKSVFLWFSWQISFPQ